MKRAVFALFWLIALETVVLAFDVIGLQPVSPNGLFSTFGAESNLQGDATIEITAERAREPDFYRYSLRASYGLTDSVELELMVPYVANFGHEVDGLEDISFGVKHRFYDEGKYGPSLAYLINASFPSGRGSFSTDGRIGAGLILSKRVGPFRGHANIFYERPGNRSLQDELSLAGGIEFSAAHSFRIIGEIFAKKAYYSEKYDQIEARFGYRLKTTDSIYTTFGAGVDLRNSSPAYRLFLSVSYSISRHPAKIRKIIETE